MAQMMPHPISNGVVTQTREAPPVKADKLRAYPPGAVVVLPGNTSHFHWAKSGEHVTQVSAIGPFGMEYINSKHDPRNKRF